MHSTHAEYGTALFQSCLPTEHCKSLATSLALSAELSHTVPIFEESRIAFLSNFIKNVLFIYSLFWEGGRGVKGQAVERWLLVACATSALSCGEVMLKQCYSPACLFSFSVLRKVKTTCSWNLRRREGRALFWGACFGMPKLWQLWEGSKAIAWHCQNLCSCHSRSIKSSVSIRFDYP